MKKTLCLLGIFLCITSITGMTEKIKEKFVVAKFKHCFIALVDIPEAYATYHLRVIPYAHGAGETLSQEVWDDMHSAVRVAINVLTQEVHAPAFNFGNNQTEDQHFYIDIVPRYEGDTGFIQIISHTRVITNNMQNTFKRFKAAFDAYLSTTQKSQ